MKAEDTVMAWTQMVKVMRGAVGEAQIKLTEEARAEGKDSIMMGDSIPFSALVKAQAEISFKAGRDEEYKKWIKACMKAGMLITKPEQLVSCYKLGIKEVVEEIQKHNLYEKKNSHSFYHDGGISFETSESLDDREWWQSKLKEWNDE